MHLEFSYLISYLAWEAELIEHDLRKAGDAMLKQASTNKVRLLDLLMITIGCGIYALGFVKINIANRLAEGGVTGISLIIYHLFHVDPSISTLCIKHSADYYRVSAVGTARVDLYRLWYDLAFSMDLDLAARPIHPGYSA